MVKSKRVSKTNFKKRKVNRKKAKSYKKCARTKSMWSDSKIVKAKRTKRNNVKSVKSVQSKQSVRSFHKKSNRIKKSKQSLVKKTNSRRIKSNISVDSSDDDDDDDDYDDEEDEDNDEDDEDDDDDDSPPPPKLMEKFTSPPSTTSIISTSSSVSSPSNVSIDLSQQVPPHTEQEQVKHVQAVKQVSLPKAPPTKLPTTQSTVEPKKPKLPESDDEEIQWEVSNRELEQHEDRSIESVQSSTSSEASLSLEDSITLEVSSPSEESEEEESEEKEPELPEAVKQYMHSENFTLVKYIVSSTTCSVYKVTNGDGRCRAAKVIDHSALPELIRDSHLPDELAIIRSVRHPNIILTDAILTKLPNYSIIISEFASEGDLTGYIEKTGIDPPDVNLSKKWFREITNALVYLHQKFIAHRDIKLDNILLFEELTAKLCDFGFATYCRDQKTGAQVLCETFCGTVEYQAPEILLCEDSYNGMTADCFSLGVFLYRLLTGHLPFVQDNKSVESTEELTELHTRIHAKKWDKIGPIAQDEDLRSLLLQLLNPNTEERIQVAQVLTHRWISRVE